MHSRFRTPILAQLRDQQVRFAPRSKRLEQLERAEKLINEIDAEKTYTYEYVCFRITDYRPESNPQLSVNGDDLSTTCSSSSKSYPMPPTFRSRKFRNRYTPSTSWRILWRTASDEWESDELDDAMADVKKYFSSKIPRFVSMYLLDVTRLTVDSCIEIASATVFKFSGRRC